MVKTEELSAHSPTQELNKSDCSPEVQVLCIKCSRQTPSIDRNLVLSVLFTLLVQPNRTGVMVSLIICSE